MKSFFSYLALFVTIFMLTVPGILQFCKTIADRVHGDWTHMAPLFLAICAMPCAFVAFRINRALEKRGI